MSDTTIFAIIDEEFDLFSALYETLENQQRLILTRNTDALAEATQNITALMEQARQCRMERSDELKQYPFSNSAEGMMNFCKQYGSDEDLKLWLAVVELVERCKALNLENGEALRLQRDNTEKQLHRLTRHPQNTRYSATGQRVAATESRLQVQA